MRKAARAIILHDNKLVVMHRNKFGKEYDTLPGGNVEVGESPEEALRREVLEETGLELGHVQLVFIEEAGELYGTQYIYACEYLGGEPALAENSEETAINKLGQNMYTPIWVDVLDLPNRPFLSEDLRDRLLASIDRGFPQEPENFITQTR
ncbi:NUDIX domain-containing protein [soil metagenome]